ncbi:UDP-glucose/GDP-mannose dehydrogenase family protein [Candidatus Woesearchaeota archaeon]|nr:UDP-glucose/GDP-mannose dehydrogenase family protein [Candidatus Woesearchaeota archaeon]
MIISVAGSGFVGLVHGAVLSKQGHKVILFDINQDKINSIINFCEGKSNDLPIFEEGLPEILRTSYKNKLIEFTTDSKRAIRESTFVFIAVGTPPDANGKADLSYVDSVAHKIGEVLKETPSYKIIVNKSTVPVGTARRVRKIIEQYYQGEFEVASNPETLAEGRAVMDSLYPNRLIVGVESEKARKLFEELYSSLFSPGQSRIHFMAPESSELTKYACNTYLASQVALTNVFANLAKKAGANWREMIPAVLGDERIGRFVHPGLGFGGSCFMKDVSQLYNTIKEIGGSEQDFQLLKQVLEQNENQKMQLNIVLDRIYPELNGKKIAVWGLAFKKDTNDIREAASLKVIPDLLKKGAKVIAHDPQASEEFMHEMKKLNVDTTNLMIVEDMYEATKDSEALLILNDWKLYRRPDYNQLRSNLSKRLILDGKDVFNYESIKEQKDFEYHCIGRPSVNILL